ncbi:MAG: CHAT domain-containing tetratricopeptide repeat protein [Pirellulaceae bacterium]
MTQSFAMRAAMTATPIPRGNVVGFLSFCVAAALTPLILIATPLTQEISPDAASQDPVAQRQQLLATRETLIRSANEFYQDGKYDEAMQRLQHLLSLQTQLYPASEFPDGHQDTLELYQDMCRIAKAQKNYPELLRLSEEGLRLYRLLFHQDKGSEHSDIAATLHGCIGVACFSLGDFQKSRDNFTVAEKELSSCTRNVANVSKQLMLANIHDYIAELNFREGNLVAATERWALAVEEIKACLRVRDTVDSRRCLARYLLLHACALGKLCKPKIALELATEAHEINLRSYFVTGLQQDRSDVLQSLVLLGLLNGNLGRFGTALKCLENAAFTLQQAPDLNTDCPGRFETVLINLVAISIARGDRSQIDMSCDLLLKSFVNRDEAVRRGIDELQVVAILRHIGAAFRETHNFDLAERYYLDALNGISESALIRYGVQMELEIVLIRNDLAVMYGDTGRYDDAHAQFTEAFRLAGRLFPAKEFPRGHILQTTLMQNLAMHYWLHGETEKGASLFREVVAMNEALFPRDEYPNGHPQLQESYSAWANVLTREKRFDEAVLYASKANEMILSRSRADDDYRWHDDLATSWIDLGRLRRARADYESARSLFSRALESYESRGCSEQVGGQISMALALAELGRTYAAEGDFPTALTYQRRSLAIREELFSAARFPMRHPSLANALRDLGLTCLDAGQPDEAFQLLAQSVTMEHAIGESFFGGGSEAQLLNFAARKFQSLGPLLRAWHETGRPAEEAYVFVWVRHGLVARVIGERQHVLRELARENSPAIYARYVAARQDLSRALLVSVTDDPAGDRQRREWLEKLNKEKEDLEHELTRSLETSESKQPAIADIRSLANALPETAAFVDLFSYSSVPFDATIPSRADTNSAEHVAAFVICRNCPVKCVDLGNIAEIAPLVTAWNETLMANEDAAVGAKLREIVWDPLSACLPKQVDTIYIAPDGVLGSIAWGALPENGGVLLERYTIATVPHGPFLLDQLQKPPINSDVYTPLLVIGDVEYGDRIGAASTVGQGLNDLRWEKLPGSRHELEAVASGMTNRQLVLLSGSEATVDNVLQGLSTAHAAHFATHGFFIDDSFGSFVALAAADPASHELTANRVRASVLGRSPFLRSGLALAGANAVIFTDESGMPSSAEGILTAEMVAAVDARHLQLVVLSACETSRGDAATGEGLLGIQSAFHIAGVRNVIAGLWKVPDAATVALMHEFYRLLGREKMTPLAALRSAQLHVMRGAKERPSAARGINPAATVPLDESFTGDGKKTNCCPLDWAGFILSGPGF